MTTLRLVIKDPTGTSFNKSSRSAAISPFVFWDKKGCRPFGISFAAPRRRREVVLPRVGVVLDLIHNLN